MPVPLSPGLTWHPACSGAAQTVRQDLYDELVARDGDEDFSFLLRQVGMFSFTGLTPAQARARAPDPEKS